MTADAVRAPPTPLGANGSPYRAPSATRPRSQGGGRPRSFPSSPLRTNGRENARESLRRSRERELEGEDVGEGGEEEEGQVEDGEEEEAHGGGAVEVDAGGLDDEGEAERRGAELLGDVATGAEPLHRGALEARRAALEALHAEAEASFQNTYEMDWLQYRMRQTDAALAQAL